MRVRFVSGGLAGEISLQAYLGHKSIQHTVRYTELAPTRFKGFWRD
jgi:site-specific recombinase XerD